jgi:hypothetical protein
MSKSDKNLTVDTLELEIPNAEEDAKINAGISADPDTFEVSDTEFKKMRSLKKPPGLDNLIN